MPPVRYSTDPDYDLWVLLRQTSQIVLQARERELSEYGLSTVRAAVLLTIRTIGDKATPAEISRWLLREDHSVSSLLTRMERDGLVRRVKDLNRKNLVRITLTEQGREAYYQSARRRSVYDIMSILTDKEREQLMLCLVKIRNKALDKLGWSATHPLYP